MKYPLTIQKLIDAFATLPTVGQKTAERYVFYLLKKNQAELARFAEAIAKLKDNITLCQTCLAISETDPCAICADAKRDKNVVCVVAGFRDMISLESTKQYHGLYHIIGGTFNAIEGTEPSKARIEKLLRRIKNEEIKEIILALNPDLEGETTAMHLTKLIKQPGMPAIRITRLAKGLPMGADLEYADEITLSNALKYRNEF